LVWLKPSYLGDAVMATPLLDGLIGAGVRPAVLAGNAVQQVLEDRAQQVQFIAAENLSNPLTLLKQARDLRARGFQTVLLVNRSFRSALAARFARIPQRIGHDSEGRGRMLTQALRYLPDTFEADCYLDLAKAAGFDLPSVKPKLSVTEDELAKGRILAGEATIGMQPGARYKSKQIPIPVMAEVVKELQNQGHTVAMFGGKEEAAHGEELRGLVRPPLVNLIGITTLRETLSALANLRLMIGSDTGVMHLAAGVGCPTITVFGPNPIEKWGHNYPPHKPIKAPAGDMTRITAQPILAAAEQLRSAS
jgi:heptosyltransferase II